MYEVRRMTCHAKRDTYDVQRVTCDVFTLSTPPPQHFTLDPNGIIQLPSHVTDVVIDVGQVRDRCRH